MMRDAETSFHLCTIFAASQPQWEQNALQSSDNNIFTSTYACFAPRSVLKAAASLRRSTRSL
jgi:hypothetical protein